MAERISIITPVLNEEENLEAYVSEIEQTLLKNKSYDWEIIFVDDGSTDSSWQTLKDICSSRSSYRAIRLSRNYGSHAALFAGFRACTGQAAVFLACDLQDPPETVVEFIKEWESGGQIIFGHRRNREDALTNKLTSKVFNILMRKFAMPRHSEFTTGSFLLADRKAINAYLEYSEYNRITFAIFACTGFDQRKVFYNRRRREHGKSGWSYTRMIKAFYDAFIGFSHLPIRLITLLAAVTFCLSLLIFLYSILSWILGTPSAGWTSIVAIMALMFSTQFFVMTIVGEYLYRIYLEVMKRPIYVESDRIGFKS